MADPPAHDKCGAQARNLCYQAVSDAGDLMQAKPSTLTGVAALLFAGGLVLLFAALYRNAAHGGPLLWVGLTLLAATIGCWFAASRADTA